MLKQKNIVYVLVFLSLTYSLLGFNFGLDLLDEGLMMYNPMRILSGDIPYKDFFLYYPPGQYWLLAVIFKLFGSSLIVTRIISVIVNSAISIAVYLIAKRLSSWKSALIAWIMALLWVNTYGSLFLIPLALLFSLISCLFLIKFFTIKYVKYLFFCGLFTGITLFFRNDIGTFTFISEGIVLFLFCLFNRQKRSLKLIAYYLFGWGIVLVPVFIYLIMLVPVSDLTFSFITFPLKLYAKFYSLPFPAIIPNPAHIFSGILSVNDYLRQVLLRMVYYFPSLVYLAGIAMVGLGLRKGLIQPEKNWSVLLLVLLGLMCHIHGYIRGHIHFLRSTFFMAIILFSFLISASKNFFQNNLSRLVCFIFVLAVVSVSIPEKLQQTVSSFSQPFYFSIKRAKGICWDNRGKVYEGLIKYIQTNVPENERIFVGNARHDLVFINDIMLYYLSERHSATKYHQLDPVLITKKDIQEQIISDLKKSKINYVILWQEAHHFEPNLSGKSSGLFLLDNFIRKQFVPVRQFGDYTVYKRLAK